jgi:hypothetical protein
VCGTAFFFHFQLCLHVVLLTISIPFAITTTDIRFYKIDTTKPTIKMRFTAITLIPLLAAMSAESHTYGGTLAPRAYRFNRPQDPFDLVSDIFSVSLRQQFDASTAETV